MTGVFWSRLAIVALIVLGTASFTYADNRLDISGVTVSILLLAGTKRALNGDYSTENIQRVGRNELANWNGGDKDISRRLDACVRQAPKNR